eukprot:7317677-Prymnesium_polylepis.3
MQNDVSEVPGDTAVSVKQSLQRLDDWQTICYRQAVEPLSERAAFDEKALDRVAEQLDGVGTADSLLEDEEPITPLTQLIQELGFETWNERNCFDSIEVAQHACMRLCVGEPLW